MPIPENFEELLSLLRAGKVIEDLVLNAKKMKGMLLANARMPRAKFDGCDLEGIDFRHAALPMAF
ncbi:MAG: hypothetical protein DRH32_08585, partial [Deltaproteobacteria bacterium]